MHEGAKVIFDADDGRTCPLCEAEKKVALMREALSLTESWNSGLDNASEEGWIKMMQVRECLKHHGGKVTYEIRLMGTCPLCEAEKRVAMLLISSRAAERPAQGVDW